MSPRSTAPVAPPPSDARGLPWWAVQLLLLTTAIALVWVTGLDGTPGRIFSIGFLLACAAATIAHRLRHMFTAVAQPPLLAAVVLGGFAIYQSGGIPESTTARQALLLAAGYPLMQAFPWLLATVLLCLVIALVRWFISAERTASRRQQTAAAAARTASGPARQPHRAERGTATPRAAAGAVAAATAVAPAAPSTTPTTRPAQHEEVQLQRSNRPVNEATGRAAGTAPQPDQQPRRRTQRSRSAEQPQPPQTRRAAAATDAAAPASQPRPAAAQRRRTQRPLPQSGLVDPAPRSATSRPQREQVDPPRPRPSVARPRYSREEAASWRPERPVTPPRRSPGGAAEHSADRYSRTRRPLGSEDQEQPRRGLPEERRDRYSERRDPRDPRDPRDTRR